MIGIGRARELLYFPPASRETRSSRRNKNKKFYGYLDEFLRWRIFLFAARWRRSINGSDAEISLIDWSL